MREILEKIVRTDTLHGRWLNTLSYLENCGAKKIAGCQHETLVKEEMLKHASEEFRHAHHLKRQIAKVSPPLIEYQFHEMLGGAISYNYLKRLDLMTCRYLIEQRCEDLKSVAYLLVTYAIELRAEKLYPLYMQVLKEHGSRVTVKSILLEEKEHLKEMEVGIQKIERGKEFAREVVAMEEKLYCQWKKAIEEDPLLGLP